VTEPRVEFVHEKLGALAVSEGDVLHFDGIPGFPDAKRFALVAHDRGEDVLWLASLDDPMLALPVVDLRSIRGDVGARLSSRELAAVGAQDEGSVELLGIFNMRHSPPRLLVDAPIVFHRETRRAAQLVRERPILEPASDGVEAPDVERPGEHAG